MFEKPENWTTSKEWAATFVLPSFTFICRVSSIMIAPAVGKIYNDLSTTFEVEAQITLYLRPSIRYRSMPSWPCLRSLWLIYGLK